MKFLCDVHISRKLSKQLDQLGYSSIHVNDILEKWNTIDTRISEYADVHDLILITKDQDFRNSFLVAHKPRKLIKINLGNISNIDLIYIIEQNINRILEISRSARSFMIEVFKDDIWVITR